MTWYKVEVEIIDILNNGKCSMDQKVGDKYNYPDDRGKMCPAALNTLYPYIMALQAGGNFPWEKEGSDSTTAGCPDYKHQVVYKMTRIKPKE